MSTWKRKDIPESQYEGQNHDRVHFIADYSAQRRLSFSEVKQALWHRGVFDVNCVPVKPFKTLEAGFALQQLALNGNVNQSSFFYVNVAPRKDQEKARDNNEGEPLVYVELDSGARVVTTSGGFTLSLVRNHIEELRKVDVPSDGSQFRSRDIFPEAVASIYSGGEEMLGEEKEKSSIPRPPEDRVAYIDGFGNIKTTIRQSDIDFDYGDRIHLELNGAETGTEFKEGIFGVEEGEMVLAPGSSGGEDPFLEIVKRGGSAERQLGGPEVGDRLKLL